jgi:hypothetical protein
MSRAGKNTKLMLCDYPNLMHYDITIYICIMLIYIKIECIPQMSSLHCYLVSVRANTRIPCKKLNWPHIETLSLTGYQTGKPIQKQN